MQYHILAVDAQAGVAVFASDLYPAAPVDAIFAVREWHRSTTCVEGTDAAATGCMRIATPKDMLVKLDQGMSWPYGTHTTQLYTATLLTPGTFTLIGELDKFIPLSRKRFSEVKAMPTKLTAIVTGKPGEIVHVTALRPQQGSWVVATANVVIDSDGRSQLHLEHV